MLLLSLLLALAAPRQAQSALPEGFGATPQGGDWSEPIGITFDDNGRGYVWERGGRVWILDGATKLPTPLVDISEEVLAVRDHGLIGFALHPNFLANGWIYLLYAVDRHHLFFAGTPGYDPAANDYNSPSIARITRYTATAASGFTSVDLASRLVLLGETRDTGCPLLHSSHGAGGLGFGTDGTLLATCGDGASFQGPDEGGDAQGSAATQALAEGILLPHEDVGAFRAQLLSSLSGKLLRLDPETGDGLIGNPYYDPGQPRSPRSRVFLLGLRNPFRFTVRPGTGEHDPQLGEPGAIYLGDVGWNAWEDIGAYTARGQNLGWPVYEGMVTNGNYLASAAQNPEAPNPLFGQPGCTEPFFRFTALIVQETLSPSPSFPNPCDPAQQIPPDRPRYVHRRPDLAYGHGLDITRVRAFSGETAISPRLTEPASPVTGAEFRGFASVGGVWYTGSDFPAAYTNTYFHADYVQGWIKLFRYGADQTPQAVEDFWPDAGPIVSLATSPTTGGLYVVDFTGQVLRISYGVGVNQPPVARASANVRFGGTPLQVTFSSAGSQDPEGLPLTYSWDFDDGTPPATTASAVHTFTAPALTPTRFDVTLTVTDAGNQSTSTVLPIYVNDTPPNVSITSPPDQSMFGFPDQTLVPLEATYSDAEHSPGQLSCEWQVSLHHNTHVHSDPPIPTCSASALIDAVGCDGNTYYYRFELTVSDPLGLATTRDVVVHPDCPSLYPVVCGDLDADGERDAADVSLLRAALANPAGSPLSPTAQSRCSGIGGAECDLADLTVLRRYLQSRAPGPLPVCPAAP
jgi:glucose/arabinose dehydrogenase